MADINYDPFNDVTDPDAAVAAINTSLASLFPPTAINPFVTLGDLASIKQMNTARLLGRFTAGVGAVEEITIGANLTLSVGGVLSASGGGGGTLAATLILGNTTGANDIIMTSNQVIKSSLGNARINFAYDFSVPGPVADYVTISSDALGLSALAEVASTYTGISNAGSPTGAAYQIGVELFNDGTRNINNSWSTGIGSMMNMGVSPVFGASFDDYQDISIIENSTLARTVSALGTRRAVFIATRNSTMNAGITRSAIIGGNGITGAVSDTVYLGNNLRVVDATNTTTLQHTSATAVTNLLPTAGNHAVLNMTGFGIGGSPTINLIGSNSGTAAINVANGSLGVNTGAFKSWVATAGSPFRNSAIGIQKNSVGRILLWQQSPGTDITILANTGDDSTTINVGILVKQDTVTIQRIHNLGAPPVYTAKLNIGGSTAGATGLAAVNIQASALIPTAPGAGDMWYDGTDLFLDNGALTATTRQKVARVLTASAVLDFPNTVTPAASDLTITVTGAAVGDSVALGVPNASVPAGSVVFWAWVSAANTVTVRFSNSSAAAANPVSGTFKVTVFKN